MTVERYSIILEARDQTLLSRATREEVEQFWDEHDALYFGLRMEAEAPGHWLVYVTEGIPEDERLPCEA